MTKVKDMKRILAAIDELKPLVKRNVSDDKLYDVLSRHMCTKDTSETQVKMSEVQTCEA